jgi:chromatin segregation and condensation protein Rec8/ScpA/Scc1 (kleisin family)
MIERVVMTLSGRAETRFSTIVRDCGDGHELRTAFLAVLVLIKRRAVDAEQAVPFGEITLRRRSASWRYLEDYRAGEAADD